MDEHNKVEVKYGFPFSRAIFFLFVALAPFLTNSCNPELVLGFPVDAIELNHFTILPAGIFINTGFALIVYYLYSISYPLLKENRAFLTGRNGIVIYNICIATMALFSTGHDNPMIISLYYLYGFALLPIFIFVSDEVAFFVAGYPRVSYLISSFAVFFIFYGFSRLANGKNKKTVTEENNPEQVN